MVISHTQVDEIFMQRALELASLSRGHVSPNPLVGCIIVHDGVIIGEGWHQKPGKAHAEVNAVNSVVDKNLLRASCVYVTLEPCSHHGKTPPCADLLIRENVKKIVVSNLDSNPLVAGEGVKKLRAAGIEVITGVCEKEGRYINRRFFTYMEKNRPYIILKWAQTSDGFIAREDFDSKWISDEHSRQLVHKWRAEEDAVLVGSRTAQFDNPRLDVREWTGRNPLRIVIDRFLKLPVTLNLFDNSQPTICYNVLKDEEVTNLKFIRLNDDANLIPQVLNDLHKRNIQSVIIEGGTHTTNAFIKTGLWDEALVFISPKVFEKGIAAPIINSPAVIKQQLKSDLLLTYFR